MHFIGYILTLGINIYTFIIIVQVAMSWLIAFDIVNSGNDAAQRLTLFLHKATDPIYKPLKRYIPPIGGIDLTPLIVLIALSVLGNIVVSTLMM